MSLLICKECGKEYSNMSEKCPICACPTVYNEEVEKAFNQNETKIKCTECGVDYEASLAACPSCACPTEYNLNLKPKTNPVDRQLEISIVPNDSRGLYKDNVFAKFNNAQEIYSHREEETEENNEDAKSIPNLKYLLNPLHFDGRISRMPYTVITIISTLIALICFGLVRDAIILDIVEISTYLVGLLFLIGVAFSLLDFSVTVRRLHDIGRSGYYVFLLTVPIISTICWIALMLIKSENEPNKYSLQQY